MDDKKNDNQNDKENDKVQPSEVDRSFGFDIDPSHTQPSEVDRAFGFQPIQPNTGFQNLPPQQTSYRTVNRRDNSKQVLALVLALVMAVGVFIGGFFLGRFTNTPSEEVRALQWAMDLIDTYYIGDDVEGKKLQTEDYMLAMLKGLTGSGTGVFDLYSTTYTPLEMNKLLKERSGYSSGFGLTFTGEKVDNKLAYVYVYEVIKSDTNEPTSAEKAGVKVGDQLISINGTVVDPLDLNATYFAPLKAIAVGKSATFILQSRVGAGFGNTYQVELTNMEQITPNFVHYYDSDSADFSALDSQTAYVKFDGFMGKADEQFKRSMNTMKEKTRTKLILDLRGNGGGYLTICQSLANYLITDSANSKSVTMMNTKFKDGSTSSERTTEQYYSSMNFQKIVVLIDENSASASEVLLSAMKDYNTVSKVIGTPSYGKGIMQNTFEYKYKDSSIGLTITVAKWFSPNGTWVQKRVENGESKGCIVPDIIATFNKENYPYSVANDTALTQAIAYLAA